MASNQRDRDLLRTLTFSAYDLQLLRIQTGLRLCANFRSKLRPEAKPAPTEGLEGEDAAQAELEAEAVAVIKQLKESYKRLTDGIARNRRLPEQKGFKGDALISTFTELVLVHQYNAIETNERQQFTDLVAALTPLPIYREYLAEHPGIGPAMAAVLISYFDPHKGKYASDFWAYAGLDVAPDGRGRSRRAEHLIDREYTKADGSIGTKKSVTYNPWLKSRLLGALAPSFMRTPNEQWRAVYDGYKNRIVNSPSHTKATNAQYKTLYKQDPEAAKLLWPPLRIHRAATRYMVKQFLLDFWLKWREVEGLPITDPYSVAKLGMGRHSRVA
jgi:hypothetical protein